MLELCLGLSGIPIPLTTVTAFYFAIISRWKKSLFILIISFVFLDAGFGRTCPSSCLMAPFILFLAALWRFQGNTSMILLQILPGAAIGAFYLISTAIYTTLHALLLEAPLQAFSTALAFKYILGAACSLPVIILALDYIAKKLALRRYCSISRFQKFHADDSEERSQWQ